MGTKVCSFAALPCDLSLEHLVPEDNFYRRLETRLDLSFVREMVAPLYAKGGRPSVDPVVFFKLQIVLFCEDLRSERQLMGVVADRLSIRWYLGYDLHEPRPEGLDLRKRASGQDRQARRLPQDERRRPQPHRPGRQPHRARQDHLPPGGV